VRSKIFQSHQVTDGEDNNSSDEEINKWLLKTACKVKFICQSESVYTLKDGREIIHITISIFYE
jgi:hypothetical protein